MLVISVMTPFRAACSPPVVLSPHKLLVMCLSYLIMFCIFGLVCDATLDDVLDLANMEREAEDIPETTRPPGKCKGGNFVCNTIMQYGDEFTVPEGPNCACPECGNSWKEPSDRSALTWHHYERQDWLVQYLFCRPIIPEKVCRMDQEDVVKMETDVNMWNIRLRDALCQCPNGLYKITSWWKQKNNTWLYNYACRLPTCVPSAVCTKIYLADGTNKKKIGYKFMCTCPENHLCPSEYDEDHEDRLINEDSKGRYAGTQCELIRGR